MVFWIAILSGALFIWLAVRLGFYETWVLLFNVVISIYVSIFLAPVVAGSVPMPCGAAWCMALSMFVLAGGCFVILHGLSYVFLTGQFHIPFPSLFDVVFSGILGFAAGFLVLSFASLVLATTPLAERRVVNTLGVSRQGQQANIAGITRCCDIVHSLAGFADSGSAKAAVARLFEMSDCLSESDAAPSDANAPAVADSPQPQSSDTEEPSTRTRLPRRTIPTLPD